MRKITQLMLKTVAGILLAAVFAILATSVSPVYRFSEPKPFAGPDIFNPYQALGEDSVLVWKRANFHTHTKVKGLLNECDFTPAETYAELAKYGTEIVTFSNHNELTTHPFDPALQVNVYEHGYNLYKYHKLVFGCDKVCRFDNILPLFAFQKQFQLDLLGRGCDFIQMNHPFRTGGTSESQMKHLSGYRIMELDSGVTTEQEYWDWALSAGHYSFGLANDDLHYPDRSWKIAVRCNFLHTPSGRYEDLRRTLLRGDYYSMRVPDYGSGNWDEKIARNATVPHVDTIGLHAGDSIFVRLSQVADSIKVTGQGHKTLLLKTQTDKAGYKMLPGDTYARFTAYFPTGEVIYSNPFARYDSSAMESPYENAAHPVDWPLTILFNLAALALCCIVVFAAVRLFKAR